MELSQFPHVLAALNLTSVALLLTGWRHIRSGRKLSHRRTMLGAVAVSLLFMAVYLYYHANSGLARFGGDGLVRPVYFSLLASHVMLAGIALFIVPWTLFLALSERTERHRRWARWVLPTWLYVAGSGIVVYLMAVHIYPWQGN